MTRVVADSNIFVSALRFGGKPEKFLQALEERRFVLVASEKILVEIAEVLSRKFGWTENQIALGVGRIRAVAELIIPTFELTDCTDPDDNRILEASVEGRADCIVSGDKHLLRMKTFRGIEILTVSDFLLRMDARSSEIR